MKWRSRTRYEPLSMIPANGWQAVYAISFASDLPEEGAVCTHASPLVAFVLAKMTETLVYEDGTEKVIGPFPVIDGYHATNGSIDRAEEASGLIGYLPPGRPIPDWMER